MFRTFDFKCKECANVSTYLVEGNNRDDLVPCIKCGGESARTFSTPILRTAKTSTTYVDGIRKNSKEFAELRTQSKLEDAVFDASDTASKTEAVKELNSFIKKGS